jgi:hypothetical protein
LIDKPPCIPCTGWPVSRMRSSNWCSWVPIVTDANKLMPIMKESVSNASLEEALFAPSWTDMQPAGEYLDIRLYGRGREWSSRLDNQPCSQWKPMGGCKWAPWVIMQDELLVTDPCAQAKTISRRAFSCNVYGDMSNGEA